MSADYLSNYFLAMGLMFLVGVFNSAFMVSVMSSLQLMVPDRMRGRVMGFYGMTWSLMPLGGMWSGSVANYLGAPFAVSIGGLAIIAFAVGPAALNNKVRNIGNILSNFQQESRDNTNVRGTIPIGKV